MTLNKVNTYRNNKETNFRNIQQFCYALISVPS